LHGDGTYRLQPQAQSIQAQPAQAEQKKQHPNLFQQRNNHKATQITNHSFETLITWKILK
jgi:hypothetical protein